jgi:hypothetical protein
VVVMMPAMVVMVVPAVMVVPPMMMMTVAPPPPVIVVMVMMATMHLLHQPFLTGYGLRRQRSRRYRREKRCSDERCCAKGHSREHPVILHVKRPSLPECSCAHGI